MRNQVKMLLAIRSGTMLSGNMAQIKSFPSVNIRSKSSRWSKRKTFKMNARKQAK